MFANSTIFVFSALRVDRMQIDGTSISRSHLYKKIMNTVSVDFDIVFRQAGTITLKEHSVSNANEYIEYLKRQKNGKRVEFQGENLRHDHLCFKRK